MDDPQDLVRLLRGAGVLAFRITAKPGEHPDEARMRSELRERGPRNVRSSDAHWYRINKIDAWHNNSLRNLRSIEADPAAHFAGMGYVVERHQGNYYMLAWDTPQQTLTPAKGAWRVAGAFEGQDEVGRPSINFNMDTRGGQLLGNLTRENVKRQMAVLLDDEVYTAPTLQSAISTSGQITGDFSPEERRYIIRTLRAGALGAKLSPDPISVSSLAPDLGADNLDMGFKAAVYSLIAVALFMTLYYFWCGVIAVIALLVNAVIILGCMALNNAAFTMPGIAGIILTFGMAVDSNVLVYERMREELSKGNDLRTAVRLGFSKALSSIVDGNVTNLIVVLVLGFVGTPEIRGFAITMGIGVVSTLFCAIVVTRLIFDILVGKFGWRHTHMLPTAVPGLQRLLTPKFDWMKWRYVFFGVSSAYVALGMFAVFNRGELMLDNEFRGGTKVTMTFLQKPGSEERETLTRAQVQDRLTEIAEANQTNDQIQQLRSAEVIPINPRGDGITSDQFEIRTVATDARAIVDSVVAKFSDKLEARPPIAFVKSDRERLADAPSFRIVQARLGDNIDRPAIRNDVRPYLGGQAIVLENLSPMPTLESLADRLERLRQQADYSDTLTRPRDVIVIEGDDNAVKSAVVIVRDEALSSLDNLDRWEQTVAQREWNLVREALTQTSTPASVQQFSPAIAATFRAQAVTATLISFILIGIYIWVRFKGARYSVAAVVALVHDVLTVVGLIALCEILYDHAATEPLARSIGLLPFKIDLNMIAALLTIAGYSLNDTIVVMDRIRENRGKSLHASRTMINTAVNETFSRTVITGGSTLLSCLILYTVGGEGVRAFAFALLTGLIVGTYSSVAVAAPIVWSKKEENAPVPD
jgi:SecD/SecF fusion protein